MSRHERIRKERGGVVSLALDPVEAAVIRGAFADLMSLLDDRAGSGGPTAAVELAPGLVDPFTEADATPATPPDDPALARLLPDAYNDDPEAAAEFRRFTERDLVAGKLANIKALLGTLEEAGLDAPAGEPRRVRLDSAALDAWLWALNDLRLALGSRLEIEDGYEEQIAGLPLDDPRLPHFALYEWLTGLQDALVRTRL
jgi:hypothetical protein